MSLHTRVKEKGDRERNIGEGVKVSIYTPVRQEGEIKSRGGGGVLIQEKKRGIIERGWLQHERGRLEHQCGWREMGYIIISQPLKIKFLAVTEVNFFHVKFVFDIVLEV